MKALRTTPLPAWSTRTWDPWDGYLRFHVGVAWRTSNRTAAARPGGAAPKSGSGFIQRARSAKVKTRTTPGIRAASWADRDDARVRVGRPDKRRMEQARELHVVDEAPLAAKEPRVFSPFDGRTEIFRAHDRQ